MSSSAAYQPLTQSTEDADIADPNSRDILSRKRRKASTRPGSIDLKKLDNAFKRWTESIAQKVKRKKTVAEHTRKQIWHSVLQSAVELPHSYIRPAKTLDHKPPMSQAEYDALIESVKSAIAEGIHPKMIVKGSSGSYFARAKCETGRVQTVAVFKPKDEEPYGRLNPKTTKWLHRQFRWIIPFGRACLIPNLSYISEAAASLLDERLNLHIVPKTQLVSLSSPVFFYDWLDRNAAKKGKLLPEKIGSMQYFLHGYQDASEFLRKHPWPGRSISDTFDDSTHRQGNFSKRFLNTLKIICGKTGDTDELYDESEYDDERVLFDATEDPQQPFYWTLGLQQDFREELEKLVILDYLMLNTDRGADNYMIKYCEGDHEKALVDVAPTHSVRLHVPGVTELNKISIPSTAHAYTSDTPGTHTSIIQHQDSQRDDSYKKRPHIHIAAIDNSLSFPHEHPQGWRSYTYGWLFLPVSLIGRPFSETTRNHFLPRLASKLWWEETSFQLEKLFAIDPDFHPKMFKRQLSVIKGQAYNVIQSLKHADEGPLELTRRQKVLVWDDEIEVAEDAAPDLSASPRISTSTVPTQRRTRSHSSSEFPPPIRRMSMDASGLPRPIPFAAKFQRVHPGTTGVTVLEHLERLDAVEASLQRLSIGSHEEVDVAEASSAKPLPTVAPVTPPGVLTSPFSPPTSPLVTVQEVSSSASSILEEDLIALSRSTPLLEGRGEPLTNYDSVDRGRDLDWINSHEGSKHRVIMERLEMMNKKPFFSCW